MIEMGISIAAFVGIFLAGLDAMRNGLFRSLTRFLVVAFALLVAMRFWYPATDWLSEKLTVPIEQLAFGTFWVLFAAVTMPLLGLMKALNRDFVPVYPMALERVFGFILGAAMGALIAAGLLLSTMINLPQFYPAFAESRLLFPLQRMPDLFYRNTERLLAGKSGDPQSKTLLPKGERENPDAPLKVGWE